MNCLNISPQKKGALQVGKEMLCLQQPDSEAAPATAASPGFNLLLELLRDEQ